VLRVCLIEQDCGDGFDRAGGSEHRRLVTDHRYLLPLMLDLWNRYTTHEVLYALYFRFDVRSYPSLADNQRLPKTIQRRRSLFIMSQSVILEKLARFRTIGARNSAEVLDLGNRVISGGGSLGDQGR
jgi:hypothetical protein